MADPYVYPGTSVLINKEDIRDQDELDAFERIMTANRMETLPTGIKLTRGGYKKIHFHIFQDVYDWAGQERSVDIAKGDWFCRAQYIGRELARRFTILRKEDGLRGLTPERFAERAAEHVAEINAIHPFREGNGRTQRAFLQILGERAGHPIDLSRIDPGPWFEASVRSFRHGDYAPLRDVILKALTE